MTNGMSKHIFTKSEKIVVSYADAAGIDRRLFILPWRSPCLFKLKEKSAEVMVVAATSGALVGENTGGLTKQRRANVKWLLIQKGGSNKTCQPYFKRSRV